MSGIVIKYNDGDDDDDDDDNSIQFNSLLICVLNSTVVANYRVSKNTKQQKNYAKIRQNKQTKRKNR
jgi:hypothetical protein